MNLVPFLKNTWLFLNTKSFAIGLIRKKLCVLVELNKSKIHSLHIKVQPTDFIVQATAETGVFSGRYF